jgi:hypothetical protein
MGSVISNIDCPTCGSDNCFEDFYYKTGEMYSSCPECGFYHNVFYKRDENGTLIKKDENLGFEFNNLIMVEEKQEKSYSVYRLKFSEAVATEIGHIENEEECERFINEIESISKNDDSIELCELSRFVDGKILKTTIV